MPSFDVAYNTAKGGFCDMKKLFQLASMLEINAYETLKIIGPYRIERIEQQMCAFQHESYYITVAGEAIDVNALQDEQILLTIKRFKTMSIKKLDVDD